MALSQGLVQKLSTSLAMTPQLQQAIRLLQLSTVELEQEIQKAVEENPLLELDDGSEERALNNDNSDNEQKINENIIKENGSENVVDVFEANTADTVTALESSNLPPENDAPLDTTWENNSWEEGMTSSHRVSSSLMDDSEFEYQGETIETLKDHLLWQLNLSPFTEVDNAIAKAVIDAIDDNGYLTEDVDSIIVAAKNLLLEQRISEGTLDYDEMDIDAELSKIDIEEIDVKIVITRIQHFEPVGVAARNMQESLKIQLEQLHVDDPMCERALDIVNNHISLLASKDYRTLLRKVGGSEEELRKVLKLIKSLDPNPGAQYFHDDSQYVKPDVIVKKIKGQWIVDLNPECSFKLRVNQAYADIDQHCSSGNDVQYIRSHLNEAKWLIKSLETRNETLLKVARCIVRYQEDFLEFGPEKMKPLILSEIAQDVGVHESTISRVTTQKFMHTPRGIFELKYFFSSHVGTDVGGECSATAVQAKIKKLISQENPKKPLSDSAISEILTRDGIIVARRTVAKYREFMNIPTSSQRKQF
ncbi:MAG: RNA polymerase factor sigma-54 [Succinivibrionaceae bacterium]|jgi:RNA polymerase sigma-54 factor|nr:RNA polymerase factor sigma-54 [Succinivibrionaceae bacterium]